MAIQSKFGNVWTEERPFETKSCAAPRGCGWLLLCLLLTPGQRRPGQPQVGGRTKRRGADTGDQGDRSPDWSLVTSASNEGYPKVRNHGEGPY